MRRTSLFVVAVLIAVAGCTKRDPNFCTKSSDCSGGRLCDTLHSICVSTDGGFDGVGGGGGNGGQGASGGAGGTACTSSSCTGTTPVCDSTTKKCRACATAGDCGSTDGGPPVCASSGACVECTTDSQCSTPTKPVCDPSLNICRACASGTECVALNPATPACASSGACVQCVASTDCKTPTPECYTAKNSCVGCLANTDCSGTTPICNTSTNTCRGCQADSECTSTGPGVCMAQQDGRCATDSETIYVQMNGACSNSGSGTSATPFCAMDPALVTASATRDLIVVRGTVTGASSAFSGGAQQTSIVGQSSAVIAGGSNPAIHLASGDLYVRAVKLTTGASIGAQADSGTTLRLDHDLVTGNSGGGVLLDGAAFDIENTTVTNNGPGTFMSLTTWGGILINNPPSAGPTKLNFVTVQTNNQIGITCSKMVSGTDVLASGNTGGDVNPTSCGFSSCGTAGPACGAQP